MDYIDSNVEASKWDLIKILGNNWQFHHWIEEFMIKEKFIEERINSNHSYYRKTKLGNKFHDLLKNGKLMRALVQVSGRRLKRK